MNPSFKGKREKWLYKCKNQAEIHKNCTRWCYCRAEEKTQGKLLFSPLKKVECEEIHPPPPRHFSFQSQEITSTVSSAQPAHCHTGEQFAQRQLNRGYCVRFRYQQLPANQRNLRPLIKHQSHCLALQADIQEFSSVFICRTSLLLRWGRMATFWIQMYLTVTLVKTRVGIHTP